jgi:hypothetical protein
MYALTMSVASLTLPWKLVSNFMLSNPSTTSSTEAWIRIDNFVDDDTKNATTATNPTVLCDCATTTELPHITRTNDPTVVLPNVLHYCQQYVIGAEGIQQIMFLKHDFFRCIGTDDGVDDRGVRYTRFKIRELQNEPTRKDIRTAFMLCHLIPLLNRALNFI